MKMITQYDEIADHTFSIPEFDMSRYSCMEKFFEIERFNIFEAMFNSLSNGVNMEYEQVPCFAFVDSPAVITISKLDYLEKIEECLKFYLDHEEYTKCAILQTLKEKLCQRIQDLSI